LRRALGEAYELEVVCTAGAWNIEVDPAQLEVSLVNLAVNARDAMPEGGKLTIETSNAFIDETYLAKASDLTPGQYAVISVSDTGAGMPPEVIARAFEPFFTTKPTGQGTGLGLSQVYGFAKQSGGHVNLYSEVGEGVTVKMYFPRVYRSAGPSEQVGRAPTVLGRGQRILVVEDDDDLRRFVTDTLRDLNYDVAEASNGKQALEMVQNGVSFEALLTDVVMPGLNGRQLAEQVMSIAPSIKILYMTGYSRNAIIHHGRLDPGLTLLQKPFTRHELANYLGRLWTADTP
jgi:CheY-like chemotaxis protein